MNVAGPSRARPRESVRESIYERDLLALLSELSIDEMDEIQTFFARRSSAGEHLSDHDVAMSDLMQQARALAVARQDRALAQRIAAGEDVVDADQRWAPRQNANVGRATQGRDRPQQGAPAARNDTDPSQTWGGWVSSVVNWMFGSESSAAPISTPAQTTAQPAAPKTSNRLTGHDCVICQDPIRGAEVRTPCGHYYDIGCITDLFQSATKDETLFPPRCCRQLIPIALVRPHLAQTLLATLQEKQVEFGTLKRVYCSSPTCSRFLGPLSEGIFSSNVYTCPAPGCARRTCAKCRAHLANWTHVCTPDADTAQVLALAERAGWARCPGCAQLIELHLGCFHMTCRCHTEFCYLCRARWKTCACPQWDERRLMAVAEERVDAQLGRQQGARRPAPAPAPVFVPAPVPVPVRAPAPPVPVHRPVENALANRAQPAAPVQRPRPAPTLTAVPAPAPRPPVQSSTVTWEPRSFRIQATSNAGAGATSTSTSTVPTSTSSTSTPTRSWRQHAATASNTGTNTGSSTLTRTSTSTTPTSPSTSASASKPSWRQCAATASNTSNTGSSTTSTVPTSPSTSASATPSWRQRAKSNVDEMRQRLVHEMMDRLRVDHECSHTRWHYRSGGGLCQSCGHHLPLYLFRCQGCEMLACNRCRRNRL